MQSQQHVEYIQEHLSNKSKSLGNNDQPEMCPYPQRKQIDIHTV